MKPSTKDLVVVGFDPSMNNWGISKGILTLDLVDRHKSSLRINQVDVICPIKSENKQARVNSKDLEASAQLAAGAMAAAKGAHAVFVEVPVGSQSARAMASYGMCLGVLGALRAAGVPFFEVTPTEVKVATVGKRTASKADMISWALKQHPEANWPTYTRHNEVLVAETKAEHMADATAAIYAGLRLATFQQMIPLLLGSSTMIQAA